MLIDNHLTPHPYVPIKGEEGVFLLMCLSKGRRGLCEGVVRTDVPIKEEERVVRTLVPIKENGCAYSCAYQRGGVGCSY